MPPNIFWKSFKFLTFNHKKAQNRHQINTQYTKPSYFRCNRFKLPRVTNCTQKDIRAIVGRNRGQIEGNTDTQGNKQDRKIKNKKSEKIIYKNRETTA